MGKSISNIGRPDKGSRHWKVRKTTKEALRTTIEEQIVIETAKLEKLEREAHQWVQQAISNLEKVDIICLQMKCLLEIAEEKD